MIVLICLPIMNTYLKNGAKINIYFDYDKDDSIKKQNTGNAHGAPFATGKVYKNKQK